MNYLQKFFKHLKTVHNHRKEVRKMCFELGLYRQGIMHDLSKYSPTELFSSVKYWTGNRSPIDNEIDAIGRSEAWLHHKGRNKHHFEYWLDPTHLDQPAKIPARYLAEMFCDRVAASKVYLGDKFNTTCPLEYMLSRPQEEALMNHDSYIRLKWMFELYAKYGEKKTYRAIRSFIKGSRR